ncbi:MAG: DUF4179 domain-containing protein [Terrisporobacter othiniensis]|uniref:DUF4179 domain-containing protein n=1 Tax=Terrisporobacter othiniensis TaxID=1577792 RepID=UPI002914A0F0|nr:DUF4179 domain-containing protein [Terrisporobacter othiniensis]MDU6986024.1 DUF4179 domain-containing protein [Terrisporobacter othiniensis]
MQDELMIKYIKKKKENGMELLIDNYRGIITAVVRRHLGVLINYEEECVDDILLSIWDNITKFDDNDEIKSRMKSKIKCRKLNYKKTIVAASLVAILGCGVVSNETVWANVEKMWYTMQRILDFKNEEVTNYKYEINKSVESKDIKVTYKNLMIDDGNLIVEMDIDDSKFNPLEDFTQKQQKEWYVDKWGNRETFVSLGNIEAYVDKEKLPMVHAGQADYENKKRDSKGVTSVVSIIPLNEIEEDFNIIKVGKDKFPYTIDKDKTYNITLNAKKIHLSAEMEEGEKVSYGGAIRSNWSVDIPIKGEDLIKATVKYEEYKIDKNIKFDIEGIEKELHIGSLYVSPIYIKLKFTTDIDGYTVGENQHLKIKLENENGKEYQNDSQTPKFNDEKQSCEVEVEYKNIFKDSKKLKITPIITEFNSNKVIEEESIIINLK